MPLFVDRIAEREDGAVEHRPEEDGAGPTAMVVEEDGKGFLAIEVATSTLGLQGLGIWKCWNITRVRRGLLE